MSEEQAEIEVYRIILDMLMEQFPECQCYGELPDFVEELTELLRDESKLRMSVVPWQCANKECPLFGKPMGLDCQCLEDASLAHEAKVKEALK